MHDNQKSRFFYGYTIVAASFLIEACGIGAYVAFGVFFKPLLAEFGWSRATVSGATSLAYLMMGFLGVVAGSLNDRFGPRIVMAVSGLFCGCGYILLSRLDSMWQLYLFYGLVVGVGLSSVDVIALTVTARWFVRRRGMMTGIIKVGTGVGQLVLPLLASIWIINVGWRHAFAYLGIVVMLFLVGSGLMLRRDPSLKGHVPDGSNNQAPGQKSLVEGGLSLAQAARTPQLWVYCIMNFLVMNCLLIIVLHIVPHASDTGLDAIKAASVVSAIGASSMVGRLFTGALVDRIGTFKTMITCLVLLICSFLWLQVARDAWMLYLFAAIYGAGHGGFFTSISPTVARLFGMSSHGVILGVVLFSGNLGGSIGPVVAGYIFDVTRSYQLVFWLMTALCATALLLTPFLKPAVQRT
jgi:MFS family permease